ncbi:MAG: cytochrome C [Acidobacteria bacterium]|nr:MAG: cytochrome C [Acidobacteriota bacterium]
MRKLINKWTILVVALIVVGIWALNVHDWHQLWVISSAPDNIPIVAMLFLVPFFTWLGVKQAIANDRLIERLEADPKDAKTHHRKVEPWRPGWAREIHVWPYLVRVEFLATVIVTVILFVWSITLNAPLEEPANPNLTMNPSKAPWYFLGLQEMLVYFDPWIAGVVMPSIIMVGLMVFPYVDSNPLGNGYYTWRQRRFALWMFCAGFLQWILLIVIGTFIRGPGWIWFWPGQTWDHNTVVFDKNIDLHDMIADSAIGKALHLGFLQTGVGKFIFGALVVGGFYIVGALFFHWLMTVDFKRLSFRNLFPKSELEQKLLSRTSMLQYVTFQFFAITVLLAMPVKLILRLALTIKYVWVTPFFNI